MSFNASRMLAFDLETTSNIPQEARIVTSALVSIEGSTVDSQEMLADPGIEIPQPAVDVHGITTEYAREHGRNHDEVLADTIAAIKKGWEEGKTLVVYNANYDLTVLRSLDQDFTVTGPVFDPFVVDKLKDKYRKGPRTLGKVCEEYGVPLDNAHAATADAMAAARIAWKQVNQRFPELAKLDDGELMEYQAVGYYEMQTEFKRYLASRDRDASSVATSWPMQG
ncbi:exonuclease domain-containing protein [Corynebacterium propinquum]